MLCYAVLCYAMLAMLRCAMLCYAMLCYTTLRYATPYGMRGYASYDNAMRRDTTQHDIREQNRTRHD